MSETQNKNSRDPKEREIDLSLREVARQLEEMEAEYTRLSKSMPAPARRMEERIHKLQKEVDEISDRMLAHKLKRLASSKMLEVVGEKRLALSRDETTRASTDKKSKSDYESSTFKCKSDLDKCLLSSKNALDKALCFTLFIRCAVKG